MHTPPYRMRLKAKTPLTDPACEDEVVHVALAPMPGERLRPFIPGQFVRMRVPEKREPAPAFFAIASDPERDDAYEFVVKRTPGMAEFLATAPAGALVEIEGPMGKGFDLSPYAGFDVYLVGVGTGIAPLRSVWNSILRHREAYGKVAIYAGFRSPLHCLLTDELESLGEHDIRVSVSLEAGADNWDGSIGYVQDALRADRPGGERAVACLAGMSAMVDACTETLQNLGFDERRILLNF